MARPEIEDVFTPRNKEVNDKMYVSRPGLETALRRSIKGSMNSLLFGESGNGKSWLYKHVFSEDKTPYIVINSGNIARMGSITNAIYKACVSTGAAEKSSYEETKEASIKAVVAEGKLNHKGHYEINTEDKLLTAFRSINKNSILVIENLEALCKSKEHMSELGNLVLLLDDEKYGEFGIKYLLVGVPNGVLEFFAKLENIESISNRIQELPKVIGLTKQHIQLLITKGLREQLKIEISDSDRTALVEHIFKVTLGVAQRVHEYCTSLAYMIKDNNWQFDHILIGKADTDWLIKGLRSSYTIIESHLNSKETTVGRRNQVIWAIGLLNVHQFTAADIESRISLQFPETIPETSMNIAYILSELAQGSSPLVQKAPNCNAYSIVDPRYTMAIRVALKIDEVSNKVQRRYYLLG